MPWWYWIAVYSPAPFFARWYYSFLRQRSADYPQHIVKCQKHGEFDLDRCCFAHKSNFQPWPNWSAAATAIGAAILCWPLIGLIFFVMANPKKTNLEVEAEQQRLKKRIAELEKEVQSE